MKDHISVNGQDGTFAAYIAKPKTPPAPAVVVLQELFGVNADIRKHCDELAEQGFLAVAPDLFWRQEPGVDLTVTSDADWQHGLRLYGAYDRDAGAKDVKDTGLDKPTLVNVTTLDGASYAIKVGRTMGEDYFVTFTSSRDDAREKKLSAYTLLVPKSKLEDTLKPRAELLEKKPAAKKK